MTTPALSVILLAPGDSARLAKTISHLRAQTRAADIELVIAASRIAAPQLHPHEWREFAAVQIVRMDEISLGSIAKARALSACSAPVIAFIEDHVFPSPNWAEVLIEAHARPYSAVSVEMVNANPSPLSRADMMLSFGQWLAPAAPGPRSILPGHNTSYKRQVLERHGARLVAMLDAEAVLHQELKRGGHELYLETRASLAHLNISRPTPFFWHKYWGGRIFGGARREQEHWSPGKRLLYVVSSPLIPLLRLVRMIPDLTRTNAFASPDPVFMFALAAGLVVHAFGEVMGYLLGAGDAATKYAPLELYRADQLRADERALAFE